MSKKRHRFAAMLTKRETEIMDLMAAGLPKKQISLKMGVSEKTVERCLKDLRGKKSAKNNFSLYSVAGSWLMAGELMATLETILNYCPNLEVKRGAAKRLEELKEKYK